jgi:hypothetical protein
MAVAAPVPAHRGAFVAQAPGTLVLVGDHAEWIDGAAIVVPTGRVVTVHAAHAPALEAVHASHAGEEPWFDGEDGPLAWIGALARGLSRTWGLPRTGSLRVEGDLGPGHGQGWRASAAIATVRALAGLHGRALSPAQEVALVRDSCGFRSLALTGAAHATALHARTAHGTAHATPLSASLHLSVGRFPRGDTPRRAGAEVRTMLSGALRLRDGAAVRRVAALHSALENHELAVAQALDALRTGSAGGVGAALTQAARADLARSRDALGGLAAPGSTHALRTLSSLGALGARMVGPGGDLGVLAVFSDADGARAGATALDALGMHADAVRVDTGD